MKKVYPHVGIEDIYPAVFRLLFKFLQLPDLVLIELPQRFPLGRFLIRLYLANADKKRLKVNSLTSLRQERRRIIHKNHR